MFDAPSLLPPNATPFETALSVAAHPNQVTQDGIDVIRQQWNPATIPAKFLPWLAWALDVPIWDSKWPDEKKRRVIADSFNMHRLRGTLPGFQAILKWLDSKVIHTVTPPAAFFASPSLTLEERNAFLRKYPEVRWYRFRNRGKRKSASFLGYCFAGAMYPHKTDAIERIGERAFLLKDGKETPIVDYTLETQYTKRTAIDTKQIALTIRTKLGTFCGGFPQFLIDTHSHQRVFTVKLERPYLEGTEILRKTVLNPGLEPATIRYDVVAEKGLKKAGLFCGQPLFGTLAPSTAYLRLYRSVRLFDPSVPVTRRGATTFLGAARLGMPAFHGEAWVSIRGKCTPKTVCRFVHGHFVSTSKARLEDARLALKWSKRKAEKLWLRTLTRRPLVAGQGRLVGKYTAGQWVNI